MLGKYCMVRTRSAGVFAGTLTALEGQTATLTNARRIWYWDGAASLSQLANDGPSKPQNCKFPSPVAEVMLFEVIEIIPITNAARDAIAEVQEWRE